MVTVYIRNKLIVNLKWIKSKEYLLILLYYIIIVDRNWMKKFKKGKEVNG